MGWWGDLTLVTDRSPQPRGAESKIWRSWAAPARPPKIPARSQKGGVPTTSKERLTNRAVGVY